METDYNKQLEEQKKWSDRIFNAVSNGGARDYHQAESMVISFWVPDMSVSRAGISHALERLKRHYGDK
jgi:hypothetical protein